MRHRALVAHRHQTVDVTGTVDRVVVLKVERRADRLVVLVVVRFTVAICVVVGAMSVGGEGGCGRSCCRALRSCSSDFILV